MSDDIYNRVMVTDDELPTTSSNNDWAGERGSKYGEAIMQPSGSWRYRRCRDGTYFVAHNPTIDVATTLIGHAAPVLVDADVTLTKPLIFARMADASTVKAELDYIEIEVITAGASGTSDHWTAQLDKGTSRVTTAGTSFTTLNPNMTSTETADLAVQGGVVVVGAETANCRVLGFGTFKNTIELAEDRYFFSFGSDPFHNSRTNAAATVYPVNLPPVILGAGDSFLLALWQVAQNAAGIYKVRMGWTER